MDLISAELYGEFSNPSIYRSHMSAISVRLINGAYVKHYMQIFIPNVF